MAEEALNINLGSVQSPYLEQILTIPAGGIKKFDYVHNCFSLLDSSDKLNLTFGGAAVESVFTAGMYYELTNPVPYVILYNRNASPITIHFALGIGVIKDNRLTVSGTVLTQEKPFETFSATTVAISSGQATFPVAAKTIIQNNGSNVMYIGGTGTDGLQLQPQGTFEFSCDSTITVYGTNGDNIAIGSFN